MRDFQYHRPTSLADAAELLRRGDEAKLLAGGQSLLPLMKLDLAAPSDLVSLAGIAELGGVRRRNEELEVGAAVTHAEVATSRDVREAIPALAALAEGIGDPQVRNRGTLGGSVAHADPAADYPAALLALGATLVTDRREIADDDFFTGLYETALAEDEILTAVRFPLPERAAYAKFPHPASRFAVAGVMVAERGGRVRAAVTGIGGRALRMPELEEILSQRFDAAALEDFAYPAEGLLDDPTASAGYRAHLVGVMARRAVSACA